MSKKKRKCFVGWKLPAFVRGGQARVIFIICQPSFNLAPDRTHNLQ
jgi:hypothetical protein